MQKARAKARKAKATQKATAKARPRAKARKANAKAKARKERPIGKVGSFGGSVQDMLLLDIHLTVFSPLEEAESLGEIQTLKSCVMTSNAAYTSSN